MTVVPLSEHTPLSLETRIAPKSPAAAHVWYSTVVRSTPEKSCMMRFISPFSVRTAYKHANERIDRKTIAEQEDRSIS